MGPLALWLERAARSCVGRCAARKCTVCGEPFACVAGCATWQAPGAFNDAELRARAVTASKQGVSVTAAVLSAEDSRRMFGADVNKTGVQSVWIELQNRTARALVAAAARIGSRLLLAARSRVVRAHAARAAKRTHASTTTSTDSRSRASHPSGRNARGRAFHQPGAPDETAQYRSAPEEGA